MASDVLITPSSGLIQFSSSAGSGSGQIKVDGDDLLISNVLGDVLLGDGASDVFIGDGTNNVDIVFEQNGEIRDDGSGKNIILGSKTTNLFLTGSTSVTLQEKNGNVGIGTTGADALLHISASLADQKYLLIENTAGTDIFVVTSSGDFGKVGIGTSAPQNPLSVSGSMTVFTSNNTSRLTVGEADDIGVSANNILAIEVDGANNKSHTFTVGTGNDYIIEALGNKGDVHLSPRRDIRFGINNGSAYNFTERMILTGSTGNLGIGTSNPLEKLTVAGNVSGSGFLSIEGNVTASGRLTVGGVANFNGSFVNIGGGFGSTGVSIAADGDISTNGTLTIDGAISASSDITASGVISASGGFVGDGSNLSNVSATVGGNTFATDLKIGRDADNLIDFTTDNQIQIRVGASNELKLNTSTLFAGANDGLSLGAAAIGFSDLFLADGAVIGFNNGEIHLTQTNAALVMSGSGATRLNVEGEITSSGNISSSGTILANAIKTNTISQAGSNDDPFISANGSFGVTIGDTEGSENSTQFIIDDANQDFTFGVQGNDGFVDITMTTDATNATGDTGALRCEGGASIAKKLFVGTDLNIGGKITSNITASGDISASGQLIAGSADFNEGNISNVGTIDLDTIRGDGDTNTNIAFSGDDVITMKVGNEAVLTLTQGDGSLGDIVSVGDGGDVNFRVRTNGENNTIFVEGSSNNVGMGNSVPPKKLTVEGSISASGDIFIGESILSSSGNYLGNRQFNKTSTTDADHSGDIVYIGGTTSMDNGKIYHYKSDGTWELADADAAANCDGLLAVALGAASDINGMLLRGTVTLDHDPGAVGDVLFVSTTAGQATATAPSGNTDIVRVVGYCLDASNGQIWFNPDNTFVEVSA